MNEAVTLKAVSENGMFVRSQKIETRTGHVSRMLGEKTVGGEHDVPWEKLGICCVPCVHGSRQASCSICSHWCYEAGIIFLMWWTSQMYLTLPTSFTLPSP